MISTLKQRCSVVGLVLCLWSVPAWSQTDCQSQLNRMTELVNKANKDIEGYRKELETFKRTSKSQTMTMSQKDQFIDSLSGDLAQKLVEVVSLTSSLNARKAEIVIKDSVIAARRADISSLSSDLADRRRDVADRNEQIRGLQNDAELRKKDIATKDEVIAALKAELEAKRKESVAKDEVLINLGKISLNALRSRIEEVERQHEELKRKMDALTQPEPKPQEGKKKQ